MFELETKIHEWIDSLRSRGKFLNEDITELESHLRDEIDVLLKKDLSDEEAFIIAIKRIGSSEILSKEYGKVNTDVIWKKLIFYEDDYQNRRKLQKDIFLLILLSLTAGFFSKLPAIFGLSPVFNPVGADFYFYQKTMSLFFLPSVAGFFLIRNYLTISKKQIMAIALTFFASAALVVLMPMKTPFHTATLTGLHLPIFLWCMTGLAYAGREWRTVKQRMNFIRFSGESFIYGTLLLGGVFVLSLFTVGIFRYARLNIENFYMNHMAVFLIFGVPVIAVYLVQAKKSIVENIAPVLAKIFSPLFLATMLVFLGIVLLNRIDPSSDRNFLITFNFMLIMVAGLATYIISARKDNQKITGFDYVNLLLIIVSVLIDIIALHAIITRITEFGFSANKIAAFGVNLVLLIDLAGLAVLYVKFFIKKKNFSLLETWQTSYLIVIFFWCGIVSFIFPVIFGFK